MQHWQHACLEMSCEVRIMMPWNNSVVVKSPFPSLKGQWDGADLCFLSPQPKLLDHGYGASASCGMPVYSPAFTGTH